MADLEQAVGVNVDGLPVATWRAPKQLCTLVFGSGQRACTVPDLSFPPGSQLRCFVIKFPEKLGSLTFVNLNQLQLFQLEGARFPTLPDTLTAHAHSLRVLELINCTVHELPYDLGNLTHLTVIKLLVCRDLQRLPDSIIKLHGLQLLMIDAWLGNRLIKTGRPPAESMLQSATAPVTDTDMSCLPPNEGALVQVQYGGPDMPAITEWLNDRFDLHEGRILVTFTAKADK